MNSPSIREIRAELRALRTSAHNSDGTSSPTIDYLCRLLAGTTDEHVRADLYDMLSTECIRYDKSDLRTSLLNAFTLEQPGNLVARCMLADSLKVDPGRASEVMRVLDDAIAIARQGNRLVRYTLTYKARLAIELGEYDALGNVLVDLIADRHSVREEDAPFEFDFLSRIDPMKIDARVVENYLDIRSA